MVAPFSPAPGPSRVYSGDNLPVLQSLPDQSFQLIYIDPPFNTGRVQSRQSLRVQRELGSPSGEAGASAGDAPKSSLRQGFAGQSYRSIKGQLHSYDDSFTDYWAFLEPRLLEAWRLLEPSGSLYLHLDYREVHYAKVCLDAIFGRECFLNEIIWAYDYGARAKRRWPAKHDNILLYVKDPEAYYFDSAEVDREPYMAPGLVTAQKAARGKLPTDVWWHTIVSPTGKEKTGYPSQKPEGILRRIITASSRPGDWVLDFFAGSGTTGAVAWQLERPFVLVEQNPPALEIMEKRFTQLGAKVLSGQSEAALPGQIVFV